MNQNRSTYTNGNVFTKIGAEQHEIRFSQIPLGRGPETVHLRKPGLACFFFSVLIFSPDLTENDRFYSRR